jgi:hypothetical protein
MEGAPHSVFTVRDWEALGFVDGLELANLQPELYGGSCLVFH